MEKMLISGGNGFLGSHLAEKAISEGIDVTVLDDFFHIQQNKSSFRHAHNKREGVSCPYK
jgi:nucleoside-diphosphate-sugar epimerase